ncbi:MAG: dockerin type I repeat-containing protein [Muribaculaceae bacterium]|nr:dockerin type I repeat-containing protein [Muribaculaceae bacterium]
MKKLFTILVSAASVLSMAATTVTVTPNGSTCTLMVDDITLTDVSVIHHGEVNIAAVHRGDVTVLACYTDAATLVADGTLRGEAFHYATPSADAYIASFQIPNGGFEAWRASSGEPDRWHGFKSAKGWLAGRAKGTLASSDDVRPGSTGSKSALLTSASTFGIINNGTMTNGQLQAASMSASDAANHSEMDVESTETDNNGDRFYTALKAAPDAIATWIKFSQATYNADHRYATMSAVAFDGTYYQDPEDKTYTNVAAKAQNQTIEQGTWRLLTIPFDYDSYATNQADANAILITISTNADAGQGSNGDQVWVDDMTLVYNAAVAAITATGLEGFAFNAEQHSYALTYKGAPLTLTADNFTVTTVGRSATAVKAVEDLGDGNYSIVLGAVSADMSTATFYTITVTRQSEPEWQRGDVDHDGFIDIADVNAIINALLTGDQPVDYDLNGDGSVDIGDVNEIINIMLKSN